MSINGSRRPTLVLVVEDLHWIDRVSEEFFSLLVDNLQGAEITLLCTYRPGYSAPWMRSSYATQLSLPRLNSSDSPAVVNSVLESDGLASPIAETLVSRAEGNPFFLEELARTVRDGGGDQGGAGARAGDHPRRPRSTCRSPPRRASAGPPDGVGARSRVPPPPPGGRVGWIGATGPAARRAQAARVLYEAVGGDETVFVFKHALTQDVAYEGLLTGRRKALHEAAGRALERIYEGRIDEALDRLAHHYSRTSDSERAVEYLDRFAAGSVRTYAHAGATTALRQALVHVERIQRVDRDRRTVDLVMRLVNSLYSSAGSARASTSCFTRVPR